MEAKKTLLYDEHIELGGKMADFAGWNMPLWYAGGQSKEHHATRNACGLFDICHMGEFEIRGAEALPFLSRLLTNNIEKLQDGQAMYNFMLNEQGGVVDDCILYRYDEEYFMLVVNAGDIAGDFEWLKKNAPENLALADISDEIAKIDLQGPAAPGLIAKVAGLESIRGLKFFRFRPGVQIHGMEVLLSRTGYTGEVGFEIYTHSDNAVKLWNLLLEEGTQLGCMPCGLAARDTLRTEAGLPLYGHELMADKPALAHPWMFAMDFDTDFIGKAALETRKADGIDYHVCPFIMEGRRKAMPGWEVLVDGKLAGLVLSGVIAPTMENTPIGFIGINTALEQDATIQFRQPGRDHTMDGHIVAIPFVRPTSRKKLSNFVDELK
ncbi:glycine cleavage system aminomethyltransferase GcvT [bacterium]|nr:glycine cleavage system aminomethyltransferase GcvT [bacterium]